MKAGCEKLVVKAIYDYKPLYNDEVIDIKKI